MERSIQLLVLLGILFGLSNCKKEEQTNIVYDKNYIDEIKTVRKETSFYLARNFIPGANVAVAKDGKIIYSEGFGLASKDLEVPATRETKFRIGEASELFTSVIYHKLIEQGVLHPDSSVQAYYPEFPEKKYKVTLEHLVNHTSGIRMPNQNEENWRGLNVTIEKGLEQFKDDPLESPPNWYQVPSFFNYNLLATAMEKATGKSYKELLKSYVTDTLGLTNTVIDHPLITIKGRTDYFDHNVISQIVNALTYDLRYRAPSSGLLSNAEDLVKLGNLFLEPGYFSEETLKNLFVPVTLFDRKEAQMANGWLILVDNLGNKIIGRQGRVVGGSAALVIYPEEKLVVACAVNLKSINGETPVFDIAKHFLPPQDGEQENN